MIKSKVLELLKTFDPEEIKRFSDFLRSPFFNTNKKCVEFFAILKKFHPGFGDKKFTKENLYRKIYGNDDYTEWKIRNLFSDLNILAEKFIVYNGFSGRYKTMDHNFHVSLVLELQNRGLYELSLQNILAAEKLFLDKGLDRLYYQRMTDLTALKWTYGIYKNDNSYKLNSIENYACFYANILINEMIEQVDNARSLSTNFNFDPSLSLGFKLSECIDFEKIVMILKESKYENSGVAEMYYYFLRLAKNPGDEGSYEMAKKLYMTYFNKFSDFEKYNSIMLLENIALILRNINDQKYLNEILELYDFSIKNSIHIFPGVKEMDAQLFANMVFFACEAGKFEWAENIVEKFTDQLAEEFRENMLNYSKAILHFEKKDFEKALKNILHIKYDFPRFRYETKILTLKIYFELGHIEELLSVIDNLKHLISNNETLSSYKKRSVQNFLKHFTSLVKVKTEVEETFSYDINKEVESSNEIQSKKWLLEKIKMKQKGA